MLWNSIVVVDASLVHKPKQATNVNNNPIPGDVFFVVVLHRGNALRQGSSWRSSRGPVALLLVLLCVCGAAVWMYVTSLDSDITETLVSRSDVVSPQPRVYSVPCSEDYENYKRYPGEAPLTTPACVIQAALITLLLCSRAFVELTSPTWFTYFKILFSILLLQPITCLHLTHLLVIFKSIHKSFLWFFKWAFLNCVKTWKVVAGVFFLTQHFFPCFFIFKNVYKHTKTKNKSHSFFRTHCDFRNTFIFTFMSRNLSQLVFSGFIS